MRARIVLYTDFGEIVSDPEDLTEETISAFNGWSKRSRLTIPVTGQPFAVDGSLIRALVVKPEETSEDRSTEEHVDK
ncbi:MAG TPA: hypothetical protein VLH56_18600 [Dissulfurispiraceae bacterium]|nr:hypothetical protein [Dissulfurispiraceae bacterium]